MGYVDTHCHVVSHYGLHSQQTSATLGLSKCALVCLNLQELNDAIVLKRKYPTKYTIGLGIFPCDVYEKSQDELDMMLKAMESDYVDFVGEIGLDYHWEKDSDKQQLQKEYFIKQIKLANFLHKPINVHTRDAWDDTLKILKENKTHGIIHCFSGSPEIARECVKLGLYISYSGTVTFKNANKIVKSLNDVPLNRILTETDSPYLTPVPFRGKGNQPVYVKYVADFIADYLNVNRNVFTNQVIINYDNVLHCR